MSLSFKHIFHETLCTTTFILLARALPNQHAFGKGKTYLPIKSHSHTHTQTSTVLQVGAKLFYFLTKDGLLLLDSFTRTIINVIYLCGVSSKILLCHHKTRSICMHSTINQQMVLLFKFYQEGEWVTI